MTVNILDEIAPEAGAFYVMDRGYVDFERLYVFTLGAAVLRQPHAKVQWRVDPTPVRRIRWTKPPEFDPITLSF